MNELSNVLKLNIANQKIVEFVEKDVHSIVINMDNGFEPIIKYRDILTEKLNFQLISEYGITDMTQIYNYENVQYILYYNSDEDMITFDSKYNDEKQIEKYREIAAYLKTVNIKENGNLFKR